MSKSTSRAYLIDASIYIFRYYFSLPDNWQSGNGYSTAAVYGYGRWLLNFLEAVNPTQIAVCFDESLETCFRNEIYPDYKCSRALPDAALAFQLEACRVLTELMGVATYASQRFEADDLLATLAQRSQNLGVAVSIISRDKDLAQILVLPEDKLWDFPETKPFLRADIHEKFGVYPEQIPSYLALMGDAGDDIPGVPGVGAKTAAALLACFANWQDVKENIEIIKDLKLRGAKSLMEKLQNYSDQIDIALRLATVFRNAPLQRRFSLSRKKVDVDNVVAYCEELGLGQGFSTSVKRILG